MRKLVRGIVDFRKNVRPFCKDTFAQLALGQKPDTLFIACSDSRVVPNLFASSDPGDLFVIRNVGNLIPPYDEHGDSDESEGAAIEFALINLPVKEIIVCGHSECGAMGMLASGRENAKSQFVKQWLRHGDGSLKLLNDGKGTNPHLERHNILSQLNVLEQINHLKTYDVVKRKIADGSLQIHGWWFDIREADVYEYEEDDQRFHLIDDEYAKVLLSRVAEK